MKRQLFTFIFALGLSVVLNASQTFAQTTEAIRAEIPFAFSANNKLLPAGTYRVYSVNDSRSIWRIQNGSANEGKYLMSGFLAGNRDPDTVRLTFYRYGERYVLVSFRTASYDIGLPGSRGEKALLGDRAVTKMEAATVEIIAKVSR
jgi:hypothetical protein